VYFVKLMQINFVSYKVLQRNTLLLNSRKIFSLDDVICQKLTKWPTKGSYKVCSTLYVYLTEISFIPWFPRTRKASIDAMKIFPNLRLHRPAIMVAAGYPAQSQTYHCSLPVCIVVCV